MAFNEEATIASAVRSLLEQRLPAGWSWGTIWVVTSGCTDRTEAIVEDLARTDPRVRLLSEPHRLGKSHALVTVFDHARGDAVVLLNSDAVAEPGAVAALLRKSEGATAPFGVMGRPCVPAGAGGRLHRTVQLLWSMHHEFHVELQRDGGGTHLSDELLLVSLPAPRVLRDGIINDGAYLGAWLSLHGGTRRYATDARVRIDVPRTAWDHLRQRRRIHVGDRQIADALGVRPSTFAGMALRTPRRALAVAKRGLLGAGLSIRDLLSLTAGELAATVMAAWDWAVPGKDHVLWDRIARPERHSPAQPLTAPGAVGTLGAPAERRLRSLLDVARQFRTGISLAELTYLLPRGGPEGADELRSLLTSRPDLVRLEGDRAFAPDTIPHRLPEREARGARYLAAARELVDQDLRPTHPWLCFLGVTGSAAYGAPEPGDDLDLMAVSRRGALWPFLVYTYLAVRFRFRPSEARGRPTPCLNLVVDDATARREYPQPRGFLIAREALTAHPLLGRDYYRRLLHTASWLDDELPRLYRREALGEPIGAVAAAPVPVRALNAALFPWVAAYLQAVGLRRNAAFRREGRSGSAFRTVTTPGKLAFESVRFDRLAGVSRAPTTAFAPHAGVAPAGRPTSYR